MAHPCSMAWCKYYYLVNLARRFSVCSQSCSEKKIDIYQSKPLWHEVNNVKQNMEKLKEKEEEEYYGAFRERILMKSHKLGQIVLYKERLSDYLAARRMRNAKRMQRFMQSRVDILGPDLAATHFIVTRGGSVKFWRRDDWIGGNNRKVPLTYIPGYYVERIDASGTDLYYEGLECLYKLKKLKWLSLSGLKNINDFALDLISGEYGPQLEYLDISGCTGITHYGLSCCYRFEQLKILNVAGIEQTPEFKLSCLMIQDLLPDLEIKGIDFSVPDETEMEETEIQHIDKPVNLLQ